MLYLLCQIDFIIKCQKEEERKNMSQFFLRFNTEVSVFETFLFNMTIKLLKNIVRAA